MTLYPRSGVTIHPREEHVRLGELLGIDVERFKNMTDKEYEDECDFVNEKALKERYRP